MKPIMPPKRGIQLLQQALKIAFIHCLLCTVHKQVRLASVASRKLPYLRMSLIPFTFIIGCSVCLTRSLLSSIFLNRILAREEQMRSDFMASSADAALNAPPAFFSGTVNDTSPIPEDSSEDISPPESTAIDGLIKTYLSGIKDQIISELKMTQKVKCYDEGTFWMHPRDPYFALQKSGKSPTGVTPDSLYWPSVFVWLPEYLHKNGLAALGLKCPNSACQKHHTGVSLSPKGWNDDPIARRVVGLDRVYYVLTRRVQCASAGNGCGKSWNLYDSKIMEQLDPGLSAAFPAFLTHRSGVDKTVMTLIRAGMANSMNSNSWAKVLRELHFREKDLRELNYLYAVMTEQAKGNHAVKVYEPFSDFEDRSKYAGFTPHRTYITAIYVDYMDHIRSPLDQCVAALKCEFAKWDHSHKLTKYLMKLGGVTIFAGLFTLVNEFEQIRYQAFVPTKSLAHIRTGLEEMVKSLESHGHPPVRLGWTDNVASDSATFLDCIPSLGANLDHTRLEDFSELPPLVFPVDITVNVCSTELEIISACNLILEKVTSDSQLFHVGFDMEWEYSGSEFSRVSKKTSLIQIALDGVVLLLRTHLLTKLPSPLLTVLHSEQIIKVGRNIGGDLAKLARDFPDYQLPSKVNGKLPGVVELGAFAKSKNAVPKGTASLSAITAAVLNVHLSKEGRESPWDAPSLSADQRNYAASDAWVSLEIWRTLKDCASIGLPLSIAGPVGQAVSVYLWKQEVAQGIVVPQPRQFPISVGLENSQQVQLSVSTTRTRALIEITNILAPKCILTHHKKTLEELKGSNVNFLAVVNISSLRTRSLEPPSAVYAGAPPEVAGDLVLIPPPALGSLDSGNTVEDSDNSEDELEVADGEMEFVQPSTRGENLSNIFADVFHEMAKVTKTIKKKHVLHDYFAAAFSDTMLVPDKGDKQRLVDYLAKSGKTWESERYARPDWVWKRVRRYIPDRTVLYPILKELFDCWGPLTCTVGNVVLPLFNSETRKKAAAVLNDVRKGIISDPPGFSVFVFEGCDQAGLNLFHCIRGTNSVEGAVHTHIIKKFGSLNASPPLADALVADFRHRHNTEMDAVHIKGKTEYRGHHDPWIDHEKNRMQGEIPWKREWNAPTLFNDCNPFNFPPTVEQFGITRIPDTLRIQGNFDGAPVPDPLSLEATALPFSAIFPLKLQLGTLSGKRTNIYEYLASAQHTKYAVVPVHTAEETKLFNQEVKHGGKWSVASGQPSFENMAAWWSSQANGKTIFYKLPEHLTTQYKAWQVRQVQRETMVATRSMRRPNEQRIRSSTHVSQVLPALSIFPISQRAVVQREQPVASQAMVGTSTVLDMHPENMELSEPVLFETTATEAVQSEEVLQPYNPPIQHLLQPQITLAPASSGIQPTIYQSNSTFISWDNGQGSNASARTRTCRVCQNAGRTTQMLSCPGRNNRTRCVGRE
ncbi:hypothetical protein C8R46DRAFT_88386 [Mycena filopes]|nr:hypothetical protein C8R46DRAFT_88386 [Mycena filopes]